MELADPLMTKDAVAHALRCSPRTLERLVRAGRFPAPLRHGKEALWFESVVRQWLQHQRELQQQGVPEHGALYQPELPPQAASTPEEQPCTEAPVRPAAHPSGPTPIAACAAPARRTVVWNPLR